ncbi:MAG: DNA topoisomerase I, partial [Gammaproteobacteria bacterium]|nr:DNA topoisomerase I [Gammaproteobacteria bacterium]
ANIGRFGPYIKFGSKYASLKAEDDPYTITFERACEVVVAKKISDANRIIQDFGIDDIQVLNGRYGPYITDKQCNARIPKERDPKTLTLEECRALLEAAPQRPGRGRFGKAKGSAAKGSAVKGKTAKAKTPESAAGDAAPETPKKKTATKKSAAKAKAAPKKKSAKKSSSDKAEG